MSIEALDCECCETPREHDVHLAFENSLVDIAGFPILETRGDEYHLPANCFDPNADYRHTLRNLGAWNIWRLTRPERVALDKRYPKGLHANLPAGDYIVSLDPSVVRPKSVPAEAVERAWAR
jgi:hypothetical protein